MKPEWQDISTAPKDGSTVLAIGDNYGHAGGPRHMAIVYWDEDRAEPGFYDRAEGDSRYVYLTHWCPVEIPRVPEPTNE